MKYLNWLLIVIMFIGTGYVLAWQINTLDFNFPQLEAKHIICPEKITEKIVEKVVNNEVVKVQTKEVIKEVPVEITKEVVIEKPVEIIKYIENPQNKTLQDMIIACESYKSYLKSIQIPKTTQKITETTLPKNTCVGIGGCQ